MKNVKRKAAGALFVSKNTKRILLCMRPKHAPSFGSHWATFGGKVEDDENVFDAMKREIQEELKYSFDENCLMVEKIYSYENLKKTFVYHLYLILVEDEFVPKINHENSGYGWFDVDSLPRPLIPSTVNFLLSGDFKRKIKNL